MKWFRINNQILSLENVAKISLDGNGITVRYQGGYYECVSIPQSKARYAEDRTKEDRANYEKMEQEFNKLWEALANAEA